MAIIPSVTHGWAGMSSALFSYTHGFVALEEAVDLLIIGRRPATGRN
jgi:hypothetical protein